MKSLMTMFAVAAMSASLIPSLQAGDLIPAHGSSDGQFVERTQLSPTEFHVLAEGTGTGLHVGKFVENSEYFLHVAMIGDELYIVGDGTWIETAANGDTVYGTFSVQRPLNSNIGTFTYVVEGGTGGFTGSFGYGTGVSETAADGIHYTTETDGLISNGGARKK